MASTARALRPRPSASALSLRIGVVHDGRILEERLFPPGRAVTVGASPRSALLLPTVGPERLPLFVQRNGRPALRLHPSLRGKIDLGDGVQRLDALRALHGPVVVLPDCARGKVQIEDYTLLFQLVAAPPTPRTRPGQWSWTDVDWIFLALVAVSALVHAAVFTWIQSQPAPTRVELLESLPPSIIYLPPAPQLPEPPAPNSDPTPTDEHAAKPTRTPAPVADPDPPASEAPVDPQPAAAPSEDTRSVEEKAREIGLIGAIKENSKVQDLINDPGIDSEVGDAVRNSPTRVAVREQSGLRTGPSSDDSVRGVDLNPSHSCCTAPSRRPEKTPELPTPVIEEIAPKLPEGSDFEIGPWLRYLRPRFKACYERGLRGDPDLAGSVSVSFVTDARAVVSDAWIDASSIQDAAVTSCILREVRTLKLPPEGADLDVEGYKLVFSGQ